MTTIVVQATQKSRSARASAHTSSTRTSGSPRTRYAASTTGLPSVELICGMRSTPACVTSITSRMPTSATATAASAITRVARRAKLASMSPLTTSRKSRKPDPEKYARSRMRGAISPVAKAVATEKTMNASIGQLVGVR